MKKMVKKAIALLCVLAMLFSLTVAVNADGTESQTFDNVTGENITDTNTNVHDHVWDNWFQYDNEYHKKTCGCGEIELEEHDWDDGKVSIPATDTEDGVMVYTCIACKALRYETIAAGSTGGTTTGGTTTEGTGETTGSTGGTTTGGTTTGDEETGDCEHIWNEDVTLPATHEDDGIVTYTCMLCGDLYEDVIPAKGHAFGDWTSVDAENHKKVCSCGDEIVEEHNYDDGEIVSEPTQDNAGVMLYTCLECGRKKFETIPPIEEDTGDSTTGGSTTGGSTTGGSTTGGSTTGGSTTGGSTTGGSTTGGSTTGGSTTGGSTTGGSTTGGSTTGGSTTGGSTTGGSETEDCEHNWNEDITLSATHTDDGIKTYTCILCGDSYTEVIPALGHSFGDWKAVDAENHKKVCDCGEEVIENHKFDDGVIVSEPTQDKAGVMLYTCLECGRKKLETIPPIEEDTGDSTTGGSTTGGSTTGGSTTGGSTTGGSTTGGSTTGGSTTGGSTTGGSTTGGSTTGGSTTGGSTTGGSTTGGSTTGGSTTGGSTTGGSTTGGSTTGGSTTGGSTTGGSTTGGSTTGGSTTGGSTTGGSTTGGSTTGGSTTGGSTTGGSTTGGSTTGGSTTGGSTTGGSTTGGSTTGGSTTGGSTTGGSTTGGSTTGGSTTGGSTTGGSTTGGSTTGGSTTGGSTTGGSTTGGSTTGGSTTGGSTTGGSTTGGSTTGGSTTDDPCATGHTWDNGVVTTPATHVSEGVMTYTCICGETKTEIIEKTPDHEWDNGVVTLKPTITTEGVKTYTCICGETKTETIEKLPAPTGDPTIKVSDMRANAGATINVPINLSNNIGLTGLELAIAYDTEVLSLRGYVKGSALSSLTFTNPGKINANPIKFLWDSVDADYSNGCIVTLMFKVASSAITGDYKIEATVETACDQDVKDVEIETIDGTISVSGKNPPVHQHSWGNGVVTTPATHITEGVMTYTCTCGETKTEVIEKTPDHEWGEGVVTSQPNHVSAGERTYTCICGETKTESIPKNPGHIWDEGVITTPATHIAEGVKTYTCICGETKTEVISKLADHEWGEGVITTPATHIAEGVKTYTCICGETKTEVISKLADHEYGNWEKEDDTNHKKTCSCGEVVREAHTWDEGVVTLEPTYSAEGIKTYTCSVCNGTKTEAIDKLIVIVSGGGGRRPSKTDEEPKEEEPEDENPIDVSDFNDVNENDWFYSAIEYAVEKGLMAGTSTDKFDPYMNTTRGMIITVLYRLEGSPAVSGTTSFADVDIDSYYADAVVWGVQNGIIYGFTETEYGPNVNVTREQLVVIMHRYAQFKGYNLSQGESVNLATYSDADQVSGWATEAIKYGVGSGLILGRSSTTLNPKDSAMRSEFAAIMQRFIGAN